LSPLQQAEEAGSRGAATSVEELSHESAAGHLLQDGEGTLADGSTWKRVSGEEKGDNGYWCRCAPLYVNRLLRGVCGKGVLNMTSVWVTDSTSV
jgi:hypothetical protein